MCMFKVKVSSALESLDLVSSSDHLSILHFSTRTQIEDLQGQEGLRFIKVRNSKLYREELWDLTGKLSMNKEGPTIL